MSKHTPAPWESRQNETGMYVTCVNELHVDSDGDPSDICSVENEGYFGAEQAWANCRLLASAPELYEALKHFADFPLDDFGYDNKKDDHPITGFNDWSLKVGHIRKARAALLKASPDKSMERV